MTDRSLHVVAAGWTQPTVSCSSGSSYARVAVGLRSPQERLVVGTSFNCISGQAVGRVVGNVFGRHRSVSPGDHMTLTMDYYQGSFEVEFSDDTAGWGQGAEGDGSSGPLMTHAVFVVHSKASSGQSLPLADFGQALFDNCTVDGQTLADRQPKRVRMVTSDGKVRAVPGAIDDTGGFQVTWKHR